MNPHSWEKARLLASAMLRLEHYERIGAQEELLASHQARVVELRQLAEDDPEALDLLSQALEEVQVERLHDDLFEASLLGRLKTAVEGILVDVGLFDASKVDTSTSVFEDENLNDLWHVLAKNLLESPAPAEGLSALLMIVLNLEDEHRVVQKNPL